MSYMIFSIIHQMAICRIDGRLIDIRLREGEVAIPCDVNADPNDVSWQSEANNYEEKYALSNAIDTALDRIDKAAADARSRHITVGAGQETTYAIKAREADLYIQQGRPEETASFIMLTEESSATGTTVSELVDSIINQRTQWEALAAYIEARRMGAKKQVRLVTTVQEAVQIEQNCIEQLNLV